MLQPLGTPAHRVCQTLQLSPGAQGWCRGWAPVSLLGSMPRLTPCLPGHPVLQRCLPGRCAGQRPGLCQVTVTVPCPPRGTLSTADTCPPAPAERQTELTVGSRPTHTPAHWGMCLFPGGSRVYSYTCVSAAVVCAAVLVHTRVPGGGHNYANDRCVPHRDVRHTRIQCGTWVQRRMRHFLPRERVCQ